MITSKEAIKQMKEDTKRQCDNIKKVRLDTLKEAKDKVRTARRCLNFVFRGFKCHNKSCLNEFCPLNKIYDGKSK